MPFSVDESIMVRAATNNYLSQLIILLNLQNVERNVKNIHYIFPVTQDDVFRLLVLPDQPINIKNWPN